jgi:hypothetical protein
MKLFANLEEHKWYLEEESEYYYIDLKFCFTQQNEKEVSFNALSFGASVYGDGKMIDEVSYPVDNLVYESSNQDILEIKRFYEILPEKEYLIKVWAKDSGVFFEETFAHIAPRPLSPFPSWTWEDSTKEWCAPVPAPSCCDDYNWDESSLSWLVID